MIKNPVIHLVWCIALLLLIISALLWKLPNGDNLASYISFAASLASLVLATVAIFQSIASSQSVGQAIADIQRSAATIVDETERLNQATVSLGEEAENSLRRLSDLPEKMHDWKAEISEQITQIETKTPEGEAPPSKSEDGIALNNKTIGFVLAIYTLVLGRKYNKYVDLAEMLPGSDFDVPRNYINGALSTIMYFSVHGAKIEGVASNFHITSTGSFEIEPTISRMKREKFRSEIVVRAVNKINDYFGEDWEAAIPKEEEKGEAASNG